ncbi:MAG TPA: LapA family protein [Gaiellaceae bacterium]|nr:LapA family protein [Gaiellaceae bacterium]
MASEPKPRRRVDNRAIVRLVVLALLVLYALVFVLMNRDDVEVSFVFFTATTPLIVALVLVGLIGGVAGWLARGQARRRV